MIRLLTKLNLDESKPNILVIERFNDEKFTNTDGAGKVIKEELKKVYNVIEIYLNKSAAPIKDNVYVADYTYGKKLLRKEQDSEYLSKNLIEINKEFERGTKDLPKCEKLFIIGNTTITLPLQGYCGKAFSETLSKNASEYFDYIGDDKEIYEKIKELDKLIFSPDTEFFRRLSPYAISTHQQSNTLFLLKELYNKGYYKKIITIASDPNIARNFFEFHNISMDMYYFADDTRGTRNFKKFPVSEFQNIVYASNFIKDDFDEWGDEEIIEKDKNLLFAGTIFHEKGPRIKVWEEFLKDFTDKNSGYYIPIKKNGIINKKQESPLQLKYIDERFPELKEEVVNHVSYKNFLLPELLEEEIKRYRFGFVARCVSVYDSLNMKPVQYLMNDILPIFDYAYDPDYLQIPKKFQDKLRVHNSEELRKVVDTYKDENKRLELLNEMKDYFKIDDFKNNKDGIIQKEIAKIFPEILS